ncbi:MAG: hypothetical protein QF544_02835 [Candidatus Thalassarchaeaceae archaeon]|nr:hypothetical protein [Candidatus Thalassarchaeaceae archaeon]
MRVIQPVGLTKAPLLRAGLIDEVDEVLLIGSSDVVTDDDLANFERLSTVLGSPCRFFRHDISALGSGSELLDKMGKISSLPFNGDTWLSLRGGTNLLCGCLNIKFPNLTKLSIHPREDTFSLSNGNSGKVQILTEGVQYSLMNIELRNDDEGNHQIFSSSGILIAEPKEASYDDRGKLKLSWWPENTAQNKLLGCQIGSLFNLNSRTLYDVSVTYRTMDTRLSRLPSEVQLGVGHHKAIAKRKLGWFQNFTMPEFPTDKENGSEKKLLHVILNKGDIRSTIHAIIAHEPDHVVLWVLPESEKTELTKEQMGQLRILVGYFSGEISDIMHEYLQSSVDNHNPKKPNKGLPEFSLDCMFHLAQLNDIKSDYTGKRTWPNCTETRFDILPGFTEFQQSIIRNITMMGDLPNIWYTDTVAGTLECLSPSSDVQKYSPPSPQHLFPVMGTTLRSESLVQTNDDENIKIALDTIIENYEIISEYRLRREDESKLEILSIEVKGGEFMSDHGLNVNVEVIKEDVISITIPENDFETTFGKPRKSKPRDGTWVEDLSAHIIDKSWPSSRTFNAIKGDVNIGEGGTGKGYDIDILATTSYGTLLGECKITGFMAFDETLGRHDYSPEKFEECIGQLLGSVGLVGFRRDIIPLLVISKLVPEEWYRIAHCRGVVLCDWTELNNPELILDRWRNGTPPSYSNRSYRVIDKSQLTEIKTKQEKKSKKNKRASRNQQDETAIRVPLNATGKMFKPEPTFFQDYCIEYVKLSKEINDLNVIVEDLLKISPSRNKSKQMLIFFASAFETKLYNKQERKYVARMPESAIFQSVEELHEKLKLYLNKINQLIPVEKKISEEDIQKLFGVSCTEEE